jgi:hypothetical protein
VLRGNAYVTAFGVEDGDEAAFARGCKRSFECAHPVRAESLVARGLELDAGDDASDRAHDAGAEGFQSGRGCESREWLWHSLAYRV